MSATKTAASADMEAAVAAFQDWRKSRKKLCRIPEPLWEMAANLSNHYPLNTICQNIGLNWGTLRKKIDQLCGNGSSRGIASPSFVELQLKGQEALFPFAHSNDCAVELTRPDGTIMKIFASNEAPLNLLELCKAFLEKNK